MIFMLCKHVYLGSWQHCVLHAATSAPAPSHHGAAPWLWHLAPAGAEPAHQAGSEGAMGSESQGLAGRAAAWQAQAWSAEGKPSAAAHFVLR